MITQDDMMRAQRLAADAIGIDSHIETIQRARDRSLVCPSFPASGD